MFSCELGDMTKIYVGNLPFSADESQVRALFAQHGTVESVNVIMDRETGRPRGFAFVEMSNADASRAIQSLNGYSMGGRALRVNEAAKRLADTMTAKHGVFRRHRVRRPRFRELDESARAFVRTVVTLVKDIIS